MANKPHRILKSGKQTKPRRELENLSFQQVIEGVKECIPKFENHNFASQNQMGNSVISDTDYLITFIRLPKPKLFTFSKRPQEFLRNSVA